MNGSIKLPRAQAHRLNLPIVDFLVREPELHAYVAEFVPDPDVSSELKESVCIHDGTTSARRIGELLADLGSILMAPSAVVKVAHGGADRFDFYTDTGGLIQIEDAAASRFRRNLHPVLQVLSQEIQWEFLLQHRQDRAAG